MDATEARDTLTEQGPLGLLLVDIDYLIGGYSAAVAEGDT